MGRFMLNRFVDKTQVSVVGSANNVNDQGFSGGGGPRAGAGTTDLLQRKCWV